MRVYFCRRMTSARVSFYERVGCAWCSVSAAAAGAASRRQANLPGWPTASASPLPASTASAKYLSHIIVVYSLAINICFCLKYSKYKWKSALGFMCPGKRYQATVIEKGQPSSCEESVYIATDFSGACASSQWCK